MTRPRHEARQIYLNWLRGKPIRPAETIINPDRALAAQQARNTAAIVIHHIKTGEAPQTEALRKLVAEYMLVKAEIRREKHALQQARKQAMQGMPGTRPPSEAPDSER